MRPGHLFSVPGFREAVSARAGEAGADGVLAAVGGEAVVAHGCWAGCDLWDLERGGVRWGGRGGEMKGGKVRGGRELTVWKRYVYR